MRESQVPHQSQGWEGTLVPRAASLACHSTVADEELPSVSSFILLPATELGDHWEVGWVKRLPHGCLLVSLQVKKQPRLHNAKRIHLWRPDEAPSKLSLENLRLVLHQAAPPLPEVPVRPLARRIPYLNHYSLVNRKQTPGGRYVTPEK